MALSVRRRSVSGVVVSKEWAGSLAFFGLVEICRIFVFRSLSFFSLVIILVDDGNKKVIYYL